MICPMIIYIYGVGKAFLRVESIFKKSVIRDRITGVVDVDPDKQGREVTLFNRIYNISSIESVKKDRCKKIAIIITCADYYEVYKELSMIKELADADFFYMGNFPLADMEDEAFRKKVPLDFKLSDIQLIPKKIHYCWFGGKEIPDKYKVWMESWYKYCPDYEIIRWDESNYDISKVTFMKQAYEYQKWGFVPDYARLDIVYNEGGIYLDTDVELLKPLDDLLYQKGFVGFEDDKYIALGLGFGAIPHHPVIKNFMEAYINRKMVQEDGALDLIASPSIDTLTLAALGLKKNGEYQVINDLTVFPEKVLCGKNHKLRWRGIAGFTYSIHHYDASWQEGSIKARWLDRDRFYESLVRRYDSRNNIVNNLTILT